MIVKMCDFCKTEVEETIKLWDNWSTVAPRPSVDICPECKENRGKIIDRVLASTNGKTIAIGFPL